MPILTSLELKGCNTDDEYYPERARHCLAGALRVAATGNCLRTLALVNLPDIDGATMMAFEHLSRQLSLEELVIGFDEDGEGMSDEQVGVVARMTSLRSLSLSYFNNITADGIRGICESCTRLRYVDLHSCACIDDAVLPILARLPELTTLELSNLSVSPGALLTHLRGVQSVCIDMAVYSEQEKAAFDACAAEMPEWDVNVILADERAYMVSARRAFRVEP